MFGLLLVFLRHSQRDGCWLCAVLCAVMEGVDFTRSKLPAQLGGTTKDSYNAVTKEEEDKEGAYDEF